VAVVTQPDRPSGRGHKLAPTPVKVAAGALGLRVVTPIKLRAFALDVEAWQPDAFVVASYGRIVPQVLLDTVPIAFNLHPSLLPLYRGATPLQSAIRDGRTRTGITIIAMDAGMDTGDVLLQESAAIGPTETYGELHDRLAHRGAEMLLDALARYERGDLPRTSQDRIAQRDAITAAEIAGTATRPLDGDDLRIDWHAPRGRVLDTVRAFAPQPLARTWLDDEEPLKIAAARALDDAVDDELPTRPGPFVRGGRTPWLGGRCGDGALVRIERVIAPGRGPADGAAFARSRLDRAARETSVS
jgi:methionyl-tRNA formyltransferase